MNDKLTASTKRENRLRFYWEIVTHFGNFSCSNWEKRYFLALGTIPVTCVGFIGRKIVENKMNGCLYEKSALRKMTRK